VTGIDDSALFPIPYDHALNSRAAAARRPER